MKLRFYLWISIALYAALPACGSGQRSASSASQEIANCSARGKALGPVWADLLAHQSEGSPKKLVQFRLKGETAVVDVDDEGGTDDSVAASTAHYEASWDRARNDWTITSCSGRATKCHRGWASQNTCL
ncbi:hypothetical protein LZC95_26425 [Pendulispora brunnea]|uniref:Uncharacterized protein n=1 Tax=Pendulispora brunnea TaxID=2905690 RepID=A0ABZ2JUI0_9BACT